MKTQKGLLFVGLFLAVTLAFALSASTAVAQECSPKDPKCLPECDPKKDDICICHNIGGPRDLGANCDGTGNCSFTTDIGTVTVPENHFLGIIIGFNQNSAGALKAHLNHGDGLIITTYDPPLHLASTGQNHQASNVECLAERATTTQPSEPGN